jgi:predicted dehydrogenase
MDKRIGIGIIGMGQRWRKHFRPALEALSGRFVVQAVCDQRQVLAEQEAHQLGCAAAAGPMELLEREDVEAVGLFDRQWFRLWPVEQACRRGKPVLCCRPLAEDEGHAYRLTQVVRASRVPVVMATATGAAPVLARLRQLLDAELGSPQMVFGSCLGQREAEGPFDLLGTVGTALLQCGAELLGGEPVSVAAVGLEAAGFGSLFLEFPEGRGLQLTHSQSVHGRHRPRLQVVTERGTAVAEFPNRLSWSDGAGDHVHTLSGFAPLAQTLLEHFWNVIRDHAAPVADIEAAYRVLTWLRVAVQSRTEDRRLPLTDLTPSAAVGTSEKE